MPQPDLNCVFLDYGFSDEESISAQILTPLQLAYFQSLRAHAAQEKVSIPIPESQELDRSYWLKMAELESQIVFINTLFDNHKAALLRLNDPNRSDPSGQAATDQTDSIAARAAKLVHKPDGDK